MGFPRSRRDVLFFRLRNPDKRQETESGDSLRNSRGTECLERKSAGMFHFESGFQKISSFLYINFEGSRSNREPLQSRRFIHFSKPRFTQVFPAEKWIASAFLFFKITTPRSPDVRFLQAYFYHRAISIPRLSAKEYFLEFFYPSNKPAPT
ncbi:MAG: hypothetical protein UV40_C0044G0006 [Parcubacteria group bacterium GW2011_GWA1_42_7]|nr:MAG: hypothetical protein UV40_C0044G0006 [Parcubacteria group bacterium GW2011_GWA1_42_7]